MTIPYPANARLTNLLPKLAAMTDKHRLKVLSDIDRVLAAEGVTWADVAEALIPQETPPVVLKAADVSAMVEHIRKFPDILSNNAQDFLGQVNAQAARSDKSGDAGVHLSARQAAWLDALHSKAEGAELKQQQAAPKLYLVH
jgi:hypothetical protein